MSSKIVKNFRTEFLIEYSEILVNTKTNKFEYTPKDCNTKIHYANNFLNQTIKKDYKLFATIVEFRDDTSNQLLRKHIFIHGKVPNYVKNVYYDSTKYVNQVKIETSKPIKNLKKLQSSFKKMFERDENIRYTYMTLPINTELNHLYNNEKLLEVNHVE